VLLGFTPLDTGHINPTSCAVLLFGHSRSARLSLMDYGAS